jgi:hypothetical protein
MTIRITVGVVALLLAGCSGDGGEAVDVQVADASEVDAVDAPRITFAESWADLDADRQDVYCQTHALIGREEAHELFAGRLGDDAVVPSLFAWSKLIETECSPTDTVADEPAEVEEEAEEEPDPQPDPAAEDVPEVKPASPDVPRLEGAVVPATTSAEALFSLAEDNVGGIIYLDVRFPEDDVSADEDEYIWVSGSYGLDDSYCPEFPEDCGAEYLLEDVGTHTDSGFYWVRGEWRLYGYFSVPVIAGPHQGSFSVNLRAIPIESVPR